MRAVKEYQFILASASPRRKELLERAEYRFRVIAADVDESANGLNAEEHAKSLALKKAKFVSAIYPKALVLGADTVVDLDGRIIGKPADAADAEAITRALFSRPHKVITGIALVCIGRDIEIVRSDTTTVYPRQMTEEQIAEHIAGGSWQGKAGAYAIQETGDKFVERLEGSFTNVMGLPMELAQRLLRELGIEPIKERALE